VLAQVNTPALKFVYAKFADYNTIKNARDASIFLVGPVGIEPTRGITLGGF
jgi:hypothetical protein